MKAGTMILKVLKFKGTPSGLALIERYRRREQSVEEAPVDMYLTGVSTRQVDNTGCNHPRSRGVHER